MRTKLTLLFFTLILVFTLSESSLSAQTVGRASFYSNKLIGSKMSNGERFDQDKYTCAHRTLPFGTLIKVKNLKNDKEVVVEVTDRGPFSKGRLIDISKAAAKEIEMIAQGIGTVQITILNNQIESINNIIKDKVILLSPIPYRNYYLNIDKILPRLLN